MCAAAGGRRPVGAGAQEEPAAQGRIFAIHQPPTTPSHVCKFMYQSSYTQKMPGDVAGGGGLSRRRRPPPHPQQAAG